jgi:signal transduction histidine kinase/CheY-like chemotaxis protein
VKAGWKWGSKGGRGQALRDAVLITVLVGLVGLSAVAGMWWTSTTMMRRQLSDHLGDLARELAVTVDPGLHVQLKDPGQIDGPEYVRAVTPLRRAKGALPAVKYVYTVVRDGEGKVRFVLDAADPTARTPDGKLERSGVWEEYPDADEAMIRALDGKVKAGEAAVTSEPHKDDWGIFVSGYAPIFDSSGEQVAVLGVDQDATQYIAAVRRIEVATWIGAVPAALAAVGIGAVVYNNRRRLNRTLEQVLESKNEAEAANSELQVRETTIRQLYEKSEAALLQAQQAMAQAQQAKAEAERANQSKSEFLANMSHEIRTPLTAILGFTEVLEEGAVSEQQRRETVGTIKLAGKHLLSLVNDVLDVSKVEAGQLQLECGEVSVSGVVDEVVSMLKHKASAKGLVIAARGEGKLPAALMGDEMRVRQVVANLVSNAVKFTERGGVRVSVRARPTVGEVGAYGQERMTELVVEVEDTGIGMSGADLERIFRPFGQVDTSQTRKRGGTGLGLVISRRLAELMGGTVEVVRSEPGKGTHLRFVMKLREPAVTAWVEWRGMVGGDVETLKEKTGRAAVKVSEPAAVVAVADDAPLSGRVLIVEDSVDTQRLLAFHLRKMGLTVDMSDDGEDALELLKGVERDAYVLVITDMQMPRMDGYTLVKEARRLGWRVPFVALTAHAMVEDKQRCLNAGCDAYATKPIDAAGLRKLCREWIGRRSEWAEARAMTV